MEKDKPTYYCNVAKLEVSINDFKIGLGIKKESGQPVTDADIDVTIFTSPQHLKSLVILLSEHLRIYEKLFGEIVLNPNSEAVTELGAKIEVMNIK